MSQVRRGRAELAIIIQAQNEAAAVLKGLNQQIKDVEKSTDGLNKSTDKNTGKAGTLAKAWKGVVGEGEKIDKVKGRVDMLRGVVEFAIPIVGGLVAGFIALAKTADPLERVNDAILEFNKSLWKSKSAVFKWREELGLATEAEKELFKVQQAQGRYLSIVIPAQMELLQLQAELEKEIYLQRQNQILGIAMPGEQAAIDKLRAKIVDAQASIAAATARATEAFEKQVEVIKKAADVADDKDKPPKPPKPPKSGRRATEWADIVKWNEELAAETERNQEALSSIIYAARNERDRDQERRAAKVRKEQDAWVDAMVKGGQQVAAVEDKKNAAQEKSGEIAANTADAVSGFIFQQIEDENALMALLAVKELAMGFATLATPVISAGHFTAAAMLGAQAAIGAASSAGGEDADAASQVGGGNGSGRGGPAVYNFYSGITDGQSVQLAIARSARQSSGTGRAARRGA